jgi:predicted nucleic acid-binding protein
MASKVMLDVNVLLDFMLKREQYEKSKQIMNLIVEDQLKGYITPSIVHIAAYWLAKGYGAAKAKMLLLALLDHVQVIDLDHETSLHALHSRMNDIEDALQYYTAMHHKIDFFISCDKAFRKDAIPALPVYTPDEFLKRFNF